MAAGDQGTAPAGTTWRDAMLRRGARGRVALPFATRERGRREQHRRVIAFATVAALVIAAANAVILTAAGIMPGLRGPEVRGPDTMEAAALVLLALPAGAALLLYGILWLAVLRGVRDTDGHPWSIEVTADALALIQADGARIAAPWPRWRYQGYSYTQYKGAPLAVSSLHLALDDRAVPINLLRTRQPRRLLRAILQRLAAHGAADG